MVWCLQVEKTHESFELFYFGLSGNTQILLHLLQAGYYQKSQIYCNLIMVSTFQGS